MRDQLVYGIKLKVYKVKGFRDLITFKPQQLKKAFFLQ